MKFVKYLAVFFCILIAIGFFAGKDDTEKIVKLLYMHGDWPITLTDFNENYQAKAKQFNGAQINWLRIDKEIQKNMGKSLSGRKIRLPQSQHEWEWISVITNEENSHLNAFVISCSQESREDLRNIELDSYKAAIGVINPNMSNSEIDKFVNDLTEGKLEGELIGSIGADSKYRVYVKDKYEYCFVEETGSNLKYHAISYSIYYVDESNFTPQMEELYNEHIKTLKKK